ncbi:hypothetical protein [Herbaspirillum sp.]|uniref:hypothetical protein n=1 Tax=Herbaspirillum sp. TaxID=1890675 RepID=UPI000C0909F3|nr:hypothetical protein [Herbaspirillum sp.]MAF04399.1 hypothetical protein [Herbaspirillum sp.]|tara:strand:- start:102 stop:323 length:222 start_codon:yes stop_codon:yes gene_type:complete
MVTAIISSEYRPPVIKKVILPDAVYHIDLNTMVVEDPSATKSQDGFQFQFADPRTCLSCGAKTNTAGELPCGH